MKYAVYHFLHVGAIILMAVVTFMAFANPNPKTKRTILTLSGILSLVVLVTGFGMIAFLQIGFPIWIIVKIVAWLGLTALAGIAYRKRHLIPAFQWVATLLILLAVYMVYFKPFQSAPASNTPNSSPPAAGALP